MNSRYRLSLIGLTSVFILAPLVGMASSPLFGIFGVWYQSEPMVIAFLGLSFASFAFLILLCNAAPRILWICLYHPVVLLPFTIGLYSLTHIIWNNDPLSILLGNPQMGQGAAWFFALSGFCAVGRFLHFFSTKRFLKYLPLLFVLSSVALASLTVFGTGHWKFFNYDDHIAFFGPLVLLMSPYLFTKKETGLIFGFLCAFYVIWISENTTALWVLYAITFLSLCIYGLLRVTQNSFITRANIFILVSAILILPFAIFFVNQLAIFPELPSEFSGTLRSRMLLHETIIRNFESDPFHYIFGMGWGQFGVGILKNIPFEITGTYFYGNQRYIAQEGWIWDALMRFDFHSHNLFTEIFGSLGIVGLVLIIWFFASIIAKTPVEKQFITFPAILAFVLINSMWFQMPSSFVAMGVVFGWVSMDGPRHHHLNHQKQNMLIFLGTGLIVSTIALYFSIILAGQGKNAVLANIDPIADQSSECTSIINDVYRNSYHFAELFRTNINIIQERLENGQFEDETLKKASLKRLDTYLCQADHRLNAHNDLVSGIRALLVRSDFIFRHSDLTLNNKELHERLRDKWTWNIDSVLALAPLRGDLAIPYFNWLLQNGHNEELLKRSSKLISQPGLKVVGLWFSGSALLNMGQSETELLEGVRRMQDAINGGIEKFFPVPDDLKSQILSFSDS